MQGMVEARHLSPYLIRFVRGKYTIPSHFPYPVPIRILRADTLTSSEVDFLVQCYDYLIKGVKVPAPLAVTNFFEIIKKSNAYGVEPKFCSEPQGVLFDLFFLPGGKAYLGWFHSDKMEFEDHGSLSLCINVWNLWRKHKYTCSDSRYLLYGESTRQQYCFQIKSIMTKPYHEVSLKEMKYLHMRHLNYIRLTELPFQLVTLFTKTLLGESSGARKIAFPGSMRGVEVLMRHTLKKTASTRLENSPLLHKIHEDCNELKLNWWKPFESLKGIGNKKRYGSMKYPLAVPGVQCPLFQMACTMVVDSSSVVEAELAQEIQRLSSELLSHEHRVLSQLDSPQSIDRSSLASVALHTNNGLLDSSILNFPFGRLDSSVVSTADRSPTPCDRFKGWLAAMGLDSHGYLSYSLRGCDMLCSHFGSSLPLQQPSALLKNILKLRHQLRVHHMRRYAFGATSIWQNVESAAQCLPFFESVSLSLQIRSSIAILHFSQDEKVHQKISCSSPLLLLSVLYPKLTPCTLLSGTVADILKAKGPFILQSHVSSSFSKSVVNIVLTTSQLQELQRQVGRGCAMADGSLIAVGAIFRDGKLICFFDSDSAIPFYHIP